VDTPGGHHPLSDSSIEASSSSYSSDRLSAQNSSISSATIYPSLEPEEHQFEDNYRQNGSTLCWDVGVGVFPEREKVFVGGERPNAGSIGVRPLRGSGRSGYNFDENQFDDNDPYHKMVSLIDAGTAKYSARITHIAFEDGTVLPAK
jgi:hypothetical protein